MVASSSRCPTVDESQRNTREQIESRASSKEVMGFRYSTRNCTVSSFGILDRLTFGKRIWAYIMARKATRAASVAGLNSNAQAQNLTVDVLLMSRTTWLDSDPRGRVLFERSSKPWWDVRAEGVRENCMPAKV